MNEERFSSTVLLLLKLPVAVLVLGGFVWSAFSVMAPEFLSANNLSILTEAMSLSARFLR